MVLTEPGLSVIVDAMLIARGVFQRMNSFLTYRVSATLQLVCFFFIGMFALPPKKYGVQGAEFFHLPVLMFMLITLLNDGTLMAIGYDNVVPHIRPMKWNLRVMFFISSVLAGVACVSSLLLLWMVLDGHWHNDSWWLSLGLPRLRYEQVVTTIYLKISISDFLTLFACRTGPKPFFAFAPSKVLLGGAALSLTISTIVATAWGKSQPDGIATLGLAYNDGDSANAYKYDLMPAFVWFYCVVWWFVQDAIKVVTFYFMDKYDIFEYRTMLDPTDGGANVPAGAQPLLGDGKRGVYGSVQH
jgi:H+-transporting ATPase